MRKLIELGKQQYIVVCDNKTCDYKVENPTKDPRHSSAQYVNKPCPKCGENLLTQQDLDAFLRLLRVVDFVNKWFGWLSYLSCGRNTSMSHGKGVYSIHVRSNK